VVKVDAVDSTRTCHVCGLVEKFDAKQYIFHACSGCGSTWDQDDNAAANLLDRYREREREEKKAARARKGKKPIVVEVVSESRWAKARRMAAEKTARKEGARKSASSPAE
jgi:transposase